MINEVFLGGEDEEDEFVDMSDEEEDHGGDLEESKAVENPISGFGDKVK